eukprot:13192968-Ditylum_brightwellii.AAC.1
MSASEVDGWYPHWLGMHGGSWGDGYSEQKKLVLGLPRRCALQRPAQGVGWVPQPLELDAKRVPEAGL